MTQDKKPAIRLDGDDYDYLYEFARKLARRGARPNMTEALRKVLEEHRRCSGVHKVCTTSCTGDSIH